MSPGFRLIHLGNVEATSVPFWVGSFSVVCQALAYSVLQSLFSPPLVLQAMLILSGNGSTVVPDRS